MPLLARERVTLDLPCLRPDEGRPEGDLALIQGEAEVPKAGREGGRALLAVEAFCIPVEADRNRHNVYGVPVATLDLAETAGTDEPLVYKLPAAGIVTLRCFAMSMLLVHAKGCRDRSL